MIQTKNWYRFVIALAIVAVSMDIAKTVPVDKSTKASALDLVILHNNDMHARFEQTDKFSAKCHPDEIIENKCYGGFARVSYLLKEHRKAAENGGPAVLYLNAGDTYTGNMKEFKINLRCMEIKKLTFYHSSLVFCIYLRYTVVYHIQGSNCFGVHEPS